MCVKAISALKRFTRDTKTADQDLNEILSCVQRSRNLLDILRAGLIKIKDGDLADFDNIVKHMPIVCILKCIVESQRVFESRIAAKGPKQGLENGSSLVLHFNQYE